MQALLLGRLFSLSLDTTDSPFRAVAWATPNKRFRRIEIPPKKVDGGRVEEEFITAVRGLEPVTHTAPSPG